MKFVTTVATSSRVKFLPAVYMFQENNNKTIFLHFSRRSIEYTYILYIYTHLVWFSYEIEILHININFNTKKDQITDIDAFTLVYCEWK